MDYEAQEKASGGRILSWSRDDILAAIKGEQLEFLVRDAETMGYHELKREYLQARYTVWKSASGSFSSDYRSPPPAEYWVEQEKKARARPECSGSTDGKHHGAWWGKGPESGMYACAYCGATMEPPVKKENGEDDYMPDERDEHSSSIIDKSDDLSLRPIVKWHVVIPDEKCPYRNMESCDHPENDSGLCQESKCFLKLKLEVV